MLCGRFRKTLSYECENTSAEIFSISFSFISIEEEISACTPGKKYDEDFLKTVKKWKNFIIK